MKENSFHIIKCILFGTVILAGAVSFIFVPKKKFSQSERRALKKAPELTWKNIESGRYMQDFDTFTQDQFPLRDSFRALKAYSSKYIFARSDNNGFYKKGDFLSRLEYPLNEEKIQRNLKQLDMINKMYLNESECKIFTCIIPDKNFYLKPNLLLDYNKLFSLVQDTLSFTTFIDIKDLLELEDFYFTDQHWKQERIADVAQKIALELGVEFDSNSFTTQKLEIPFTGTYASQSALNAKKDTIYFQQHEDFTNVTVTSYDSGKAKKAFVYDMEKARGLDSYEMFLGGADALLCIENPDASSNKELVVFRDSFASSLVPYLIPSYTKITLIDLRYINSGMVKNFVEFKNQDVLFLYSTLVLNSF